MRCRPVCPEPNGMLPSRESCWRETQAVNTLFRPSVVVVIGTGLVTRWTFVPCYGWHRPRLATLAIDRRHVTSTWYVPPRRTSKSPSRVNTPRVVCPEVSSYRLSVRFLHHLVIVPLLVASMSSSMLTGGDFSSENEHVDSFFARNADQISNNSASSLERHICSLSLLIQSRQYA